MARLESQPTTTTPLFRMKQETDHLRSSIVFINSKAKRLDIKINRMRRTNPRLMGVTPSPQMFSKIQLKPPTSQSKPNSP